MARLHTLIPWRSVVNTVKLTILHEFDSEFWLRESR